MRNASVSLREAGWDTGFGTGNPPPLHRVYLGYCLIGLGGSNRAEMKAEKCCGDPETPER